MVLKFEIFSMVLDYYFQKRSIILYIIDLCYKVIITLKLCFIKIASHRLKFTYNLYRVLFSTFSSFELFRFNFFKNSIMSYLNQSVAHVIRLIVIFQI